MVSAKGRESYPRKRELSDDGSKEYIESGLMGRLVAEADALGHGIKHGE
jgi:hypothetical protein